MGDGEHGAIRDHGQLPAASVESLMGLIEIQAGGIVSRTLAKRAGGTLTLFGFDAGQALSEHSAPFDAVVQVLAGRLRLRIGGQEVEARSGQVVLMPADVPHALDAAEPSVMLLTMIRGQEG
jgi:quercetin dioxygenase-like cupin family protein